MKLHHSIKSIPLVLFFVITAGMVNAQGWSFGLDGGINISNIKVVNQEDYISGKFSPRMGLHLGLFGEYGFTERWFVQLWLSYDQRGAKFKDDRTTTAGQQYQVDLSLRTHYFSLPAILKFNFLAREKMDFYGQFGPTISFLAGARAKGTESLDGSSSDIDVKLNDTWNKTTANLLFGVGVEFNHTEFGNTFVQVQYNLGLSDLQQQGFYYDDGNTDPEARGRVINVTIGAKGILSR
jgi:hypothetical protein